MVSHASGLLHGGHGITHGQRYILVNPQGMALPCHLALTLPGLEFQNVKQHSLGDIWRDSPGFNAFRGDAWMPEPCRSCERKNEDFGGCRCQAFALTGQAANTDPACSLSPHHGLITEARAVAAEQTPLIQIGIRYRSGQAKRLRDGIH